jgi:hypothetical protein
MTVPPSDENALHIETGIQALQSMIEGAEKTVERIDGPDRIDFHNQLDVLTQRRATLSRELQRLHAAADATAREDIQRRLETELEELLASVQQVSDKAERRASEATDGR